MRCIPSARISMNLFTVCLLIDRSEITGKRRCAVSELETMIWPLVLSNSGIAAL